MQKLKWLSLVLFLLASFTLTADERLDKDQLRLLAVQYEHGRGVEQDHQKAFKMYCMAADLGNQDAYYDLGWMYFNNRGVTQDKAVAAGWFERAAETGDRLAKRMLTVLAGVTPVADKNCSSLSKDTPPSRQEIESWVELWAPEYGLDPALVIAVIAAESNFNSKALSHKNAQGLMQLIPATARRFGVNDSWNPEENMHGGMAYLQWLVQQFEGDVRLVLAAYNAGEGAVERYQGIPPYRETQNYVKMITRSYDKRIHPEIGDVAISMISQ
ncbi:MAG: transglycosylase SLT domain-containing protein [Sedimenticola sp.]|nr:transglycosylase SLT domain-containing protein [Sedimenticola sp.]